MPHEHEPGLVLSPDQTEIGGQVEKVYEGDRPMLDEHGNVAPDVFKAIIAAGSKDGKEMMKDLQEQRSGDD